MKDKRKVLNQVFLKPDVLDWVIQEANKVGEDVRWQVGNMLELMFVSRETLQQQFEGNPNAQVVLIRNEMRRQKYLQQTVYQIAAMYTEVPTEENADLLADACDKASVPYDEVLQSIASDPFSSIIAQTSSKTRLDQCIMWLTSLFVDTTQISSKELYTLADKEGFGDKLVQRARDAICNDPDSPSIKSMRTGNTWIWTRFDSSDPVEEIYIPPIQRPQLSTYFLGNETIDDESYISDPDENIDYF